ncbi:unnamed protein product [Echinostoma caproni]|uniref:HTH CENPB-type domain-containing protein n=1 Tax=Echinostoma caproni TaxID=27848 RepID=A0A183B8U3_9TREM|nr:unnamed protein product [Echinostoma caproni]
MERAATMRNSRKLFHVIRVTVRKALDVGGTMNKAGKTLIHNQQRRLERWAEHSKAPMNWPPVSAYHSAILAHVQWSVSKDSPSEAEIRKELQASGRRKAPGSNGLSTAVFKDGGIKHVRNFLTLYSKVWHTE